MCYFEQQGNYVTSNNIKNGIDQGKAYHRHTCDLDTSDCWNQNITFWKGVLHIPTDRLVARELQRFRIFLSYCSCPNIGQETVYLSAVLMYRPCLRCYEDLPASFDAEYADLYRRHSWRIQVYSGIRLSTECRLPWQQFHRRHKQRNVEITLKFLLITFWCKLCYWAGMQVIINIYI